MPRSAIQLDAGKRGMDMNFDHEELMLMILYNTGTRLGLIHELRLMQCYLMPDETALRELSEDVYKRQMQIRIYRALNKSGKMLTMKSQIVKRRRRNSTKPRSCRCV